MRKDVMVLRGPSCGSILPGIGRARSADGPPGAILRGRANIKDMKLSVRHLFPGGSVGCDTDTKFCMQVRGLIEVYRIRMCQYP